MVNFLFMNIMRRLMGRKNIFFVALVCAMVLVGCAKDDPDQQFLKIRAEGFNSNSSAKAAVDGKFTYWVDGEKVWINNHVCDVHVSGSNEAEIRQIVANPKHEYRAVYPASVCASYNDYKFTVRVPREHYYKEADKRQVLDELPMVAYYGGDEDPEVLEFKHLTAAITVQVKNEKENYITLDKIVLINTQYQLGGDVTIADIKDAVDGKKFSVPSTFLGKSDSVVMYFSWTEKVVAAKTTEDIQIPIIPVGKEASQFIIKVYGHHKGTRYVFEKETDKRDNTILRANLGYATTLFDDHSKPQDLFDVQQEQTIMVGDVPVTKNFYEISSPEELLTLAEALDSGWSNNAPKPTSYRTGNYIVTEDLDMKGAKIVPIHYYNQNGKERCYFYGNNKTISNFVASSVDEKEPNACGLFGRTAGDNITVCDLHIDNATYEFAHVGQSGLVPKDQNPCSAAGGIYACIDHAGIEIVNCTVTNMQAGAVNGVLSGEKQTDFYVGGIVGVAQRNCLIKDCYVENVQVNNTEEVSDGSHYKLVDQFGAAIGRIDVGEKNTWDKWVTQEEKAGRAAQYDKVVRMVIDNFTYVQTTPMTFPAGIKNLRYGGLVGNVTRGGILVCKDFSLTHNAIVSEPNECYCAGVIGCIRTPTTDWGLCITGKNFVRGTITNMFQLKKKGWYNGKEMNRYMSNSEHIGRLKPYTDPVYGASNELCDNAGDADELKILAADGYMAEIRYPKQSFFQNKPSKKK